MDGVAEFERISVWILEGVSTGMCGTTQQKAAEPAFATPSEADPRSGGADIVANVIGLRL
jgi:hypothetical protein